MPRNQGLPIQRLPMGDNAVDIHAGLRAEQAEMHRRSFQPVPLATDAAWLGGLGLAAIALVAVVVAAVLL